jgi:hypothetical protein
MVAYCNLCVDALLYGKGVPGQHLPVYGRVESKADGNPETLASKNRDTFLYSRLSAGLEYLKIPVEQQICWKIIKSSITKKKISNDFGEGSGWPHFPLQQS